MNACPSKLQALDIFNLFFSKWPASTVMQRVASTGVALQARKLSNEPPQTASGSLEMSRTTELSPSTEDVSPPVKEVERNDGAIDACDDFQGSSAGHVTKRSRHGHARRRPSHLEDFEPLSGALMSTPGVVRSTAVCSRGGDPSERSTARHAQALQDDLAPPSSLAETSHIDDYDGGYTAREPPPSARLRRTSSKLFVKPSAFPAPRQPGYVSQRSAPLTRQQLRHDTARRREQWLSRRRRQQEGVLNTTVQEHGEESEPESVEQACEALQSSRCRPSMVQPLKSVIECARSSITRRGSARTESLAQVASPHVDLADAGRADDPEVGSSCVGKKATGVDLTSTSACASRVLGSEDRSLSIVDGSDDVHPSGLANREASAQLEPPALEEGWLGPISYRFDQMAERLSSAFQRTGETVEEGPEDGAHQVLRPAEVALNERGSLAEQSEPMFFLSTIMAPRDESEDEASALDKTSSSTFLTA